MRQIALFLPFLLIFSIVSAAEPVTLALPKDAGEPRQPQAAVAEDGDVYVAFGAGQNVYCAARTGHGHGFGDAVKVATVPQLMLGHRRGPRVAAAKDSVVITAIGKDGQLLSFCSKDRGRNWQGPATVNDVPESAREGLHALAAGPEGTVFCVWNDLRNGKMEVYGAGSTDGGKTWSQNRRVYRSPEGPICPCCHPSVTFDSEGNVYVMWRNSLGGNRDLYLSTSKDGGRTFSEAARLGRGHWKVDHCPMDGGAVAVVKPGEIATVWRRQKDVFATLPGHPEVKLGAGEQPWVAADDRGTWLTWITTDGGDLLLRRPGHHKADVIAHHANDPVIATSPAGKGPVVLAWEEGHGKTSRLRVFIIPVGPKS